MDRSGIEYMYAEDLIARGQFQTVKVEIDEVIPPNTLKSADKRPIDKTTLTFKGKKKALILCKTNESVLRYVTGESPEHWPGSTITLQVRTINAFGAQTIAIRVIPREGQPIRKSLLDRLGQKALLDTGRPAREDWKESQAKEPPSEEAKQWDADLARADALFKEEETL